MTIAFAIVVPYTLMVLAAIWCLKRCAEHAIRAKLAREELASCCEENNRLRSEIANYHVHHAELHDEVERLRAGMR
jgi:hypothetical protein